MLPKAVDYVKLLSRAREDGRRALVAALILDASGRVFIHRRSLNRRLLPGCWDVVGGHVEESESLLEALGREVAEETGWQLVGRPQLAKVMDWETVECRYREFDFVVDVSGDLARPRLETPKHTEFRWIGGEGVSVVDENAEADGGMVRSLVELALRSPTPNELVFPHATLFLDVDAVEAERGYWDPAMASQIAAHVTVVYPGETASLEDLRQRVTHAARSVAPFRLRLGDVRCFDSPDDGVHVAVEDVDGGWAKLRGLTIISEASVGIEPHVTICHPRTSNRGAAAWAALRGRMFNVEAYIDGVAITAFDGRRWPTVATLPLGQSPGGSARQLGFAADRPTPMPATFRYRKDGHDLGGSAPGSLDRP